MGHKFVRMFDQTNDAELFREPKELAAKGFKLDGNGWRKGKRRFLPLYEAKMVQAYDHRAAGVIIDRENWVRQGQTERTSLVSHQNPEFVVQPRWWVEEAEVERPSACRRGRLPRLQGRHKPDQPAHDDRGLHPARGRGEFRAVGSDRRGD